MAETNTGLKLRITHPDGSVRDALSSGANVILGSGPDAAIHIPDPKVSHLHVLLKLDNNRILAIDLGSEHGTHLGERRLMAPEPLNPGDVLTVGSSRICVLLAAPRLRPAGLGAQVLTLAPRPAPRKVESIGGAAAWSRLTQPLSPAATPSPAHQVLQVEMAWGNQLIEVRHFSQGQEIRLGQERGCHFAPASRQVGRSFALARTAHGRAQVFVPSGAALRLRSNGEDGVDAGGGLQQVEMGLRDVVQVELEHVSFGLRFVRPPTALPRQGLRQGDRRFLALAGLALLLFGIALGGLWLRQRAFSPEALNDLRASAQYVQLVLRRPQAAVVKPKRSGSKEGAAGAREEGKVGKAEAKRAEADPSRPGRPKARPNAKEKDPSRVMRAGIVGLLSDKRTASELMGPGGVGAGINHALGGLKANSGLTDAHGWGGAGSKGEGTGGGGQAVGIGGLGTKGVGHGKESYGNVDLGGQDREMVQVVPGKTTVVGGLSREVIARVIRQHQSEIKYCYETQLNQFPDLAGKVAVKFSIDGGGAVLESHISESTLGNSSAEQCMLSKIKRWRFPEPAGGGTVSVTFPWVFKPSAGGA